MWTAGGSRTVTMAGFGRCRKLPASPSFPPLFFPQRSSDRSRTEQRFPFSIRCSTVPCWAQGTVKALTKDSELLKSAKATHSKWEKAKKLDEELKLAQEDALVEFKESEAFHEEVMAPTNMHTRTVVDKWLDGPVGKQYLLDLGEANYRLGYQDAQKEIFDQLKARDATREPRTLL
nr:MAP7 domain-containing protein 1-like [Ipomoea batatas]